MVLFKNLKYLMIAAVIIYGLSSVSSVNADSNSMETKVGWAGIGAFGIAFKEDGTVWTWSGSGDPRKLINGKIDKTKSIKVPTLVKGISDVKAVAAGPGFRLALKKDGTVWTQGDNVGGQLGIGSYEDSDFPVQVKGLTKIKEINASGITSASMVLKTDNTLWSWGNGYVGDGTNWYRTFPVMIKSYDSEVIQKWDTIKVDVNEDELIFDQPPLLINNRTMVPLRKIFEAFGAAINWDQATSTITATKDQVVIKLTIGSNVGYVNDKEISLDAAAVVVNSRTLVPVRFIGSSFGANVTWDDITKSVVIKTQ
jgi:hypothetical protein